MNNPSRHIQLFLSANPLFPIVSFFAIGIVCCRYSSSLTIIVPAIALACVAAIMRKTILAGWVVATILGSLAYSISYQASSPVEEISGTRIYKASIIKAGEFDNSQSATVKIIGAGQSPDSLMDCRPTLARLTIPTFDPHLTEGNCIIFKGEMQPITFHTDLPDEWSPEMISAEQGIAVRFFINEDDIVEIKESAGIISYFNRVRHDLKTILYQTNLSPSAKEFYATAILGDSSEMTESTQKTFRDSGLSHILALSGLHVGVIAMLISLALWPLRIFTDRRITSVLVILLLWFYAAIAGFGPSVTRAVIMTSIYICGQMAQRRSSPFNSLCFAAFAILIFDPTSLFSIAFQLSFAAVASIITFSDVLNPISRRSRVAYFFASYLSISISAMIGTGFISALYFHSFPLYFLPANILITFLLPIIIGGGLILIVWQLISPVPELITIQLSYLIEIINSIASFFSNLPNSTLNNIYLSNWTAAVYFLLISSLAMWLRARKLIWGVFSSIFLFLLIGIIRHASSPEREGRLYLTRTTYRTDLIIDNLTDTLFIVSTCPQLPEEITQRVRTRFEDYMGRRNINNIMIVDSTIRSSSGFTYQDNLLRWGNKRIGLFSKEKPGHTTIDYAIVCRGYQYKISDIISQYSPDSIVLSFDLDKRRLDRYETECKQTGQPYINLRKCQWNLPFEQSD